MKADVFAPDGKGNRAEWARKPFVITQPPPNITGALHIGHALTATVEDAMIRRARMQGHPTLWVPGVDHASIAAQVVLDRMLAKEGETRASLGRERYLERMWQFINATREVIGTQHRRLGASLDWSRLRFTMDDGSARAVRVAFKRLYDDGLAYRAEQLINWCPGCRTSVSDLEVIATPQRDALVGALPLCARRRHDPTRTTQSRWPRRGPRRSWATRRSPFIPRTSATRGRWPQGDDPVRQPRRARDRRRRRERDFGTGAVKITPAHDADDFETGKRHGLPMIDVMTDDGHMNDNGAAYAGLTLERGTQAHPGRPARRRRSRRRAGARNDHRPLRAQSNDIIEPRIKTQWFVKVKPHGRQGDGVGARRPHRFVPERYRKVFFDWMENIHDWNVSRQLWWGHRIPAWYCPDGHITVSDLGTGPLRATTCGRPAADLTRETDIFDTWFSSGLWPFSTLGWPDETSDLRTLLPDAASWRPATTSSSSGSPG